MSAGPEPRPEIRPFEPAMGENVIRLILAIQQNEFKVAISLADQADLQDISGNYQKGRGGFWVAETADRRIVGTVGLIDCTGGIGALRKMFVAADYRGAGQGIAQDLLDTLLAHARGGGFTDIYLGSTAVMERAHRFYEKSGFAKIAAEELPRKFPRMAVDTHFFRMRP